MHVDNTQNIISFCSGYGGLDRGIELAGVKTRTVAYVEIEAFAVANLVAKMETGLLVPAPIWTNLKTFPMDKFRGRIHGITAGYPCQPFSVAGQRKGTDDPRHLWPYIRRIYQTIHPGWMFFENVEGHVTLGLSTVISDLEEDGYRVKAGLFTAAEVGAPHRRKRVFILAKSPRWVSRESSEWQRRKGSSGRSAKELDDPGCVRQAIGCLQTAGLEQSGEVMGNAEHNGLHGSEVKGSTPEAIQHDTQRPESTSQFKGASIPGELADTNQPRSQGRNCGIMPERAVKWPSRPGSPQYDWEEPRVIKSGMGCSTDGPDTRVDSLRLLGNGVVPQQAARAWKVLNETRHKL